MKTKKNEKMLRLNKTTIVNLESWDMEMVRGGSNNTGSNEFGCPTVAPPSARPCAM